MMNLILEKAHNKVILATIFIIFLLTPVFFTLMAPSTAEAGQIPDADINDFCQNDTPQGFWSYMYLNNGSSNQTLTVSSPAVTQIDITFRVELWFCRLRPSPYTNPLAGSWALLTNNYRIIDENGVNRLSWAASTSKLTFPRDAVSRTTNLGHKEMASSNIQARLNISGWTDRSNHRLCTEWGDTSYASQPRYVAVDPYCIDINFRYDWSLVSATTGVSASTAQAGQTVTWDHTLRNNGPGRTWGNITSSIGTSGGFSNPALPNPTASFTTINQIASGGLVRAVSSSYTPTMADVGKVLCQWMNYDPANSYGGRNGRSTQACVTVVGPPAPAATLTVAAGNPQNVALAGASVDINFTASAVPSSVVNVGDATFTWTGTGTGPMGPLANIGGTSRVDAGTGTSANYTLTATSVGTYCRTINVTDAPGFVTFSGAAPGIRQATQCINVYKPAGYAISAMASDYEKGSTLPVITYTITVDHPCGPGASAINVTWGGDGVAASTDAVAADLNHADGCSVYTATKTYAPPSVGLDNQPPGPFGNYRGYISSPLLEDSASISISESPFARFFGSDVLVCGSGADNRFIYDNRPSPPPPTNTGNPLRGSFSQYATIYASGNDPIANSFLGLRTLTKSSGPSPMAIDTRLVTNWSTLQTTCGDMPSDTDLPPATSTGTVSAMTIGATSTTINESGNVYITGNVIRSISTFSDIYNYPIVVIRAAGDIYIDPNVTNIEAVLIAGGNIYTCADNTSGTVAPVEQSQLDEKCNQPLKITGAVMAGENIVLQRAKGTRYLADTNPATWNSTNSTNSTAAEIIEFPHYLNFVKSYDLTSRSAGSYDTYRSLPPRL